MNEEFLQEIKGLLPWLLGAALVVGGYHGVKNYRASRQAAASQSVSAAQTVEALEDAVSRYGSSDAGGLLKLRLAKKYFDEGNYEEAGARYAELAAAPAPDGFAGVAAVGQAQVLEAQGKYAEAQAAFRAFAEANPGHFLEPAARLGAVRAQALGGAKDEALKALAEMKASAKDGEPAKARIEALEETVKRIGS